MKRLSRTQHFAGQSGEVISLCAVGQQEIAWTSGQAVSPQATVTWGLQAIHVP